MNVVVAFFLLYRRFTLASVQLRRDLRETLHIVAIVEFVEFVELVAGLSDCCFESLRAESSTSYVEGSSIPGAESRGSARRTPWRETDLNPFRRPLNFNGIPT